MDLVAFAQTGLRNLPKLTIAENYWDEMGNGKLEHVHITLFQQSIESARKHLESVGLNWRMSPMTESLKNANLLLMYAMRRRYLPRLLGALGIQESTGSPRFSAVATGLRKYDVNDAFMTYYDLHAECDSNHGEEWFDKVLQPVIQADATVLPEICRGILTYNRISTEHFLAIASNLPDLDQDARISA